jgi:hypothetical protein
VLTIVGRKMASAKPIKSADDIVVFSIVRDSACSEYGTDLWKGRFLRLEESRPLCLSCADLKARERYPWGPGGEETRIAEHACEKSSGRVGRTAAAKSFDDESIDLAVIAHVRHNYTEYDRLLARGWDRIDAREIVQAEVVRTIERWKA